MIAFWAVAALLAYGIFHAGGLVILLDRWLAGSNRVLIDPFPLVGKLKYSTLIGGALLAVGCWIANRLVVQPRLNRLLTDTEAEMVKVTWPGWAEVVQGTFAVTGMVLVLFTFLTCVDLLLVNVMTLLMPGSKS
jgi:preprotein translocase SecE subunit